MRKWWPTIVLNLIAAAALVVGCKAATAPPDSGWAPVVFARDARNPVERQDHWWWQPPRDASGVVVFYNVEYQRRDLTYAIEQARGIDRWRKLGVTVINTVQVPQRYAPYRIRVQAYYDPRLWMDDNSPGFGPPSPRSDWVEVPKAK